MYSLVLLMAATSAPETATWGGGCHGGWHGHKSCHGCSGGCWGSGYGWGGPAYASYACSGCCGNVTSYHSCMGWNPNYFTPFSCFGYGIYGGVSYSWPIPYEPNMTSGYGYGMPQVPNSMPRIEKKEEKKDTKDMKDMKMETRNDKGLINPMERNRAQVMVHLPADAKLYANNVLTNLTSSERQFNTPPLDIGQEYQYEMKIEYVRNGQTVNEVKQVKVRAGRVSTVSFGETESDTAVSTIHFRAPAGSTIYIEDKALQMMTGSAEYKTPELAKGSSYSYEFRAELKSGGKTHAQTQKVSFKAGEVLTVDFIDLGSVRTASR